MQTLCLRQLKRHLTTRTKKLLRGRRARSEQEDSEEQKQEPAEQNKCKHTILQQFPGHTLILSSTPYFRAQVSAEKLALSFRICIIGVSVLCCF